MTMEFKLSAQVPDLTVLLIGIRYENQTSDKIWTYALLKAGGLWYATGTGRVPQAAGGPAVERWLAAEGRIVEWVRAISPHDSVVLYERPTEPVSGVRVVPVEVRAERLGREPGLG